MFLSLRRVVRNDTSNGRLHDSVPACADMDDLFVDVQRAHLLAVCGEGAVAVMQSRALDHGQAQILGLAENC